MLAFIGNSCFVLGIVLLLLTAFLSLSRENPPPASVLIRFRSNRDGYSAVYQMHRDGSRLHRLPPIAEEFPHRNILESAEWVVYTSFQDGNAEIYIMRRDGSQVQRLTHHAAYDSHPYWVPSTDLPYRWCLNGICGVVLLMAGVIQKRL